jgi:hypothetical protein
MVIGVSDSKDGYRIYRCSSGSEERYTCRILKDDDEHIAKSSADPRERLFEAIEQDCSRKHLSYLQSFYSIDVLSFRDLIVDKAIICGS